MIEMSSLCCSVLDDHLFRRRSAAVSILETGRCLLLKEGGERKTPKIVKYIHIEVK